MIIYTSAQPFLCSSYIWFYLHFKKLFELNSDLKVSEACGLEIIFCNKD